MRSVVSIDGATVTSSATTVNVAAGSGTENGYLVDVPIDEENAFTLVANPVQFDEAPPELSRAPEHGEHTESLLLELGLDWDAIIRLKEAGAVL